MMNRRFFLQLISTTSSYIFLNNLAISATTNPQLLNQTSSSMPSNYSFYMPDESEPHLCTWMAFSASKDIWGHKYYSGVQNNLANITRAIAKYEPVKMLVREADYDIATAKCNSSVELIVCPIDDLWIRDTGPVFVVNEAGQKAAIDFNFNGWGNKQYHDRDAEVARFVAQKSGVPLVNTKLVFEGGGIEVDGRGTAIVTESCIINNNRNPGWSKIDCETELKSLLGLRKIIWLPGIRGYDITDGHTDFYARFVRPGVVVAGYDPDPESFDHAVTKKHLEILHSSTDADGKKLEVVVLEAPKRIRPGYESDDFAAGYINFYVINGAVIAPEFGDRQTDRRAKETLAELFPSRDIVQINIDEIAAGGGGIHCTTQQEPLV
ncbi:agmatine deiminase family protein [Okeania sp. SIO2C2]|uniref:agmatine deiminase family protein n=1 Tax=Okeania sp. SIO2C2 TaxID=2607787 RepID=UPI0025799EEA|nr:agmatine deiminase family protein [Okeania sp. SIO2C2]